MNSGVEISVQPLQQALERGTEVKVCTGDYLYITQPDALALLIKLHKTLKFDYGKVTAAHSIQRRICFNLMKREER